MHIYEEHIDVCKTQLERVPGPLPSINIERSKDDGLWSVVQKLNNYVAGARISAPMKA